MSPRPGLRGTRQALTTLYDVALLDLDGVVYVGSAAVPHAQESLRTAVRQGMRLAYVTNNASRTPDEVSEHLRNLGIPATADDVVTSAQAAATMLSEELPPASRVLVVGGDGLRDAVTGRGFVVVSSADDAPDAVVQGFSPDIGWGALTEATLAVRRGVPWVASNLDLTIPTARGAAPGNGTLVRVVQLATGREPRVAGKPELPLHAEAVRRTAAQRPLVVGDRLDTDIEGATRAGSDSLLVLTGVTDVIDLMAAPADRRPTYVGTDLRSLLRGQPDVETSGTGVMTDGWFAQLSGTAEAPQVTLRPPSPAGVSASPALGGAASADRDRDPDLDAGTDADADLHAGASRDEAGIRALCCAAWLWSDSLAEPATPATWAQVSAAQALAGRR